MNILSLLERPALHAAAAAVALLAAEPASASVTGANIFGGVDPLGVFVSFVTGPLAYGVVIVGLLATGASLIFGSDLSGFARRMPLVVLAGGVVIVADNVVNALFGVGSGFSVPPGMALHAWPWPEGTGPG